MEHKKIKAYVKKHIGNTSIDFNNENIIELAANVAEKILEDKHPDIEHYIEEPCGGTRFTEVSQDLFNEYYGAVRQYLDA